MVGTLQPLTKQMAIVNEDGTPNDYFIRWAQQRQVDISGGVTMLQVQAAIASALDAIAINGGTNITVTGSLSAPPVVINWAASLGDLTDVDLSTPPTGGQVLTYDIGSGTWKPGTGGGGSSTPWYWNPPAASTFPIIGRSSNESTDFTLTDDTDLGLLFTNPAFSGTGDRMRYAVQTQASGDFIHTAHFAVASLNQNADYTAVGMCLRESGTGKIISFYSQKHDASGTYFGRDTWNSNGSSYAGSTVLIKMSPLHVPWLQVQRSGSTLTLRGSYTGKTWTDVISGAVNAFFTTNLDQIGFCIGSNNSGGTTPVIGSQLQMVVDAWS